VGAAPAPGVAYRLTPVLRDGALDHLEVRLSFAGDADGVTDVRLPDRWLGQERLHEAISEPVAQGARLSRPQPALLRLTHAPSAPVTLRYQVRNGRGAEPDVDYRPDLDARGFTVLGETVLAWPAGRSRAPARAELGALPADWRSAGTLEQARTVEAVRESVTTAGSTVRVLSREVGGAPLRVAFRGRFRFADEAAADALARVLIAQRGLAGGPARPFTAVLQSLPQAGGGRVTRDGLGRGDGAVWFLSPDTPIVESLRIFAHEPLHAWLPRDVGGLPPGAREPGGYWFSEGFADFLAFRSLVRTGDWTPDQYASQLNLRIDPDAEARRPVLPNAEIVAGFGRRPELFQVPYRRGHLLALLWDSRLREATGGRLGVDDVLRAMASGRAPAR
jgi:predicted metalloprotease with PDZ domain